MRLLPSVARKLPPNPQQNSIKNLYHTNPLSMELAKLIGVTSRNPQNRPHQNPVHWAQLMSSLNHSTQERRGDAGLRCSRRCRICSAQSPINSRNGAKMFPCVMIRVIPTVAMQNRRNSIFLFQRGETPAILTNRSRNCNGLTASTMRYRFHNR